MPDGSPWPRISIVVVNFNLASYLDVALKSIVDQAYPALQLIVVDGGSTDGSVDVIRQYETHIDWWVSEADEGQADAIEKGFTHADGEIMAWLNSDDRYHYRSFWEVAKIFRKFPDVEWLMGYPTEYEPGGASINRIALPWARWSKTRYLTYDFQFIMQEATFWKRDLWEKAGANLGKEFVYAFDLELWARFFRHAKLHTTMTLLGGFRYRGEEQKSREGRDQYLKESVQIIDRERRRIPAWKRIWLSMQRYWIIPFGILFYLDIPFLRRMYERMYRLPPVIRFDFDHNEYVRSKRQVRHPNFLWKGRQIRRKPVKKG